MKRTIIVLCAGLLAFTTHAQYDQRDRLVSLNPLRNGDGSFVKANNPLYYKNSDVDTPLVKKMVSATSTSDPFAFRINSIQALCQQNSVQLNWTSVQHQAGADHFEIQQSGDAGITWSNIGIVPATKFREGTLSYGFTYDKSLGNVDFRVVAVDLAGEKRYSSIVRSACSNTNLFSVDNLVYSTANVRIGSAKTQNVRMILTNENGFAVQAREVGLTQGVNSFSVDVGNLHQGVYLLTIIWPGGGQQSAKILKQ
jgi:hypothetical protein